MSCCDAEPADLCKLARPRARKPYRCSECGGDIRHGDRYVRVRSLYEGHWSTVTACVPCHELTEWLQRDCRLVCYGMLGELLEDLGNVEGAAPMVFGHAAGLLFAWREHRYDRLEQLRAERRQR
ncbi:MAG: hypothetical protein GVY18_03625 [Bacteroidetes bacterium]|jgi:hypothetical protein|nr:hypothetical protein [Bacteroidota bacterium]